MELFNSLMLHINADQLSYLLHDAQKTVNAAAWKTAATSSALQS